MKIMVLIIGLILISGCTTLDLDSLKSSSDTPSYSTYGKTYGLKISVDNNKLVSEFKFQEEDVFIPIKIENYGKHSVDDLVFKMRGTLSSDLFSGTEDVSEISIDSAYGDGSPVEEEVELGYFGFSPSELDNDYPFVADVDACYSYSTNIESANFVEGRFDNEINAKVTNSNAPVHLGTIEESNNRDYLFFSFDISNKGGGEIGECDAGEDEKVYVTLNIESPSGVSCLDSNVKGADFGGSSLDVLMKDGKGKVVCRMNNDEEEKKTTLFRATLEYKYKESISEKMTIKKDFF